MLGARRTWIDNEIAKLKSLAGKLSIEDIAVFYAEQHGFSIQYELPASNATGGLDDERISACPVVAVASE